MRIGIILFTFISVLLCNPIYLSSKEKELIINSNNPYPKAKRFQKLYSFIKKSENLDEDSKLIQTNYFINKILPKFDDKNDDYWLNLKEFLRRGVGDCEDYAISKYLLLAELGIDKSKLLLAVVKVKGQKNYHMVSIHIKNNIMYVLDNLSWKILPLSKRSDLIFYFAFNEKDSYVLTSNNQLIKEKVKRGEINKLRETLSR